MATTERETTAEEFINYAGFAIIVAKDDTKKKISGTNTQKRGSTRTGQWLALNKASLF